MFKRILIILILLIIGIKINAQENVGIGTTTPEASAILDLTATNKGFLPPRLTTAQRNSIASPVEGLFIYNADDDQYQYYNGTTWVPIGGISSIGFVVPSILGVAPNPLINNGNVTFSLSNQNANTVFAGPSTGAAAEPTFRVLVADDIPNISANKITSDILPVVRGGTGAGNLSGILKGNGTGAITALSNIAGNITFWSDANTIGGSDNLSYDLANNVLELNGSVALTPTNTAPATPSEGQFYYNDTENKFKYYNGTAWVDFGGSGSLPDGDDAQTIRNNGGNWEATSVLRVTATNIAAGSTSFTPNSLIHTDAGNGAAHYHKFTAGTTTGTGSADGFDVGVEASGNAVLNQRENLPLILSTNSIERMRIDAIGKLSVGYSGTVNDSILVHIGNGSGDVLIDGDLIVTGNIDPKSLQLVPQNTAPVSSNVKGYLYFDNNSNTVKLTDGTGWYDLGSQVKSHLEIKNTDDASKELRLYEPSNSGNNFTAFKAQNQSNDVTYTLPTSDGANGQVLTTSGTGLLSWSSLSGGIPNLTQGSMIFSGGGTDILQDNSNLFWNNTTKRLGIGTNQPSAALEVKGDFKLGDGGTTLNQIIKTSATISVSGAYVNSAGYKSVVVTVVGARPNGSVIVNPRTQLHTANAVFFIAYSYVSADDEVTIVFAATSGTQNNFTNKVFDITVIQ